MSFHSTYSKVPEEPTAPYFVAGETTPFSTSSGSLASFSLAAAPHHDWQMRSDEQIMIEFELETEESKSAFKRYLTCCMVCYSLVTIPLFGVACCLFCPACQRADSLPNSRFFVTNRAVYYHTDPNDHDDGSNCCTGKLYIKRNLRIPFGEINEMTDNTSQMMEFGECWYCCSPPEGYGFIGISNKTLVHVQNGKHHASRYETVHIPLVHHHHNVIRLLRFLRDAAQSNQAIDWDSVRNQMNHH